MEKSPNLFRKGRQLLKDRNLGVNYRRGFFLGIANVLKERKSSAKDAFKFLTKYLATFTSEDAPIIVEAKEEATHAIVKFVKAPDIFQYNLLKVPATISALLKRQ